MDVSTISGLLNIFEKIKNLFFCIFQIKKRKYRSMPHYFKNYHKHLTIYKNGTGILINSFDIVFNRKDSNTLKRGINIEDGKKDANFPDLKTMKKVNIADRFNNFGFWYVSDDKIIASVAEKYWADDLEDQDDLEDIKKRENSKELRWVFRFNRSRIEIGKTYHVVYIVSIPGMFPIINGLLDKDSINDPNLIQNEESCSSSSIEIKNKIENFIYTVSFENEIPLERIPECRFTEIKKNKNPHPQLHSENNIIYTKYICNINKPQLGSKIKIEWKFKGGES